MILTVPAKKVYFIPHCDKSTDITNYINAIAEYKRRGDVEEDPTNKQIIPYIILWKNRPGSSDQAIFVTHRVSQGDERLRDKYSIGTGGHIRYPEKIYEGMSRELKEEVGLDIVDMIDVFEGVIMSDAVPVDRVHMGLVYSVYSIDGLPEDLKCLEEELEGQWMTIDEVRSIRDKLESWSQLLFDRLDDTIAWEI
jgi:predicted NUDIX family phosphoesterase